MLNTVMVIFNFQSIQSKERMQDKDSFVLYKSFFKPIKGMSDESLGALMRALFDYQIDGVVTEDESILMAFSFFVNQFEFDDKAYKARCQKNKESADKRWNKKNEDDANAYERMQADAKHADKIREDKIREDKRREDKILFKESTKEKIESFEPNPTSLAVMSEMGFHLSQLPSMIQSFKDQMINRTKKFKDIQSCWRNYLRKGYVKPIEDVRTQSFTSIHKTVSSQQDSGKIISMTNDEIKKMLLEQQAAGCTLN